MRARDERFQMRRLYKHHKAQQVLNQVIPSLKKRNLSLYVVSNNQFFPDNDYGVEVSNINWTPNNAFIDIQSGDFCINPGSPLAEPRFKSNNKTLISWGLGMPVAETAKDLDRFLDPKERQKESDLKQIEIKDKWDITISIKEFKAFSKALGV